MEPQTQTNSTLTQKTIDAAESVLKIESLAKDAAQVDSDKKLFTPEIKPKRGPRGPYKSRKASETHQSTTQSPTGAGDPQPQAAPVLPSKEIVKPFISVMDGWAQRMIDPKCAMKAEEADGMATGLGLILDKYMPTVMDKYAPEFVFFSCATAWGLRCYAIAKTKQDAAREEYARRVASQKTVTQDPPHDPNPNSNGSGPEHKGPSYPNAFATLPNSAKQ